MIDIVIIGASFSGLSVLNEIKNKKNYNIKIIDKKSYFEYTPSIINVLCFKKKLDNLNLLYSNIFKSKSLKNIEFIHGEAVNLSKNRLIVKKQNENDFITMTISFDYCVIASGSFYPLVKPLSENILLERETTVMNFQKDINTAQNILIIGGGATAIEFSFFLKNLKKNVTIGTRSSSLLDSFSLNIQNKIFKHIKKKQINIEFNFNSENVENLKKKYDFIINCTGNTYIPKFMEKEFANFIDNKGRIKINEYLQLKNENSELSNIFAIGDSTVPIFNEQKVVLFADLSGIIAAKNIEKKIQGKKLNKMISPSKTFVLDLGNREAIFIIGNFAFIGLIGWLMKNIIEKTKLKEIEGNFIFVLLWKIIHFMFLLLSYIKIRS